MAVTIADFVHGKVSIYSNRTVRESNTLIEQSSNNIAESVKFLCENTPRCHLRVAMLNFFRFIINLEKHTLQISALHTSLVVTLTISLTSKLQFPPALVPITTHSY